MIRTSIATIALLLLMQSAVAAGMLYVPPPEQPTGCAAFDLTKSIYVKDLYYDIGRDGEATVSNDLGTGTFFSPNIETVPLGVAILRSIPTGSTIICYLLKSPWWNEYGGRGAVSIFYQPPTKE